jgi:RNA polymerase sigma-70 factor (ECF subfamily)
MDLAGLYEQHERRVLRYLLRRTGDPELAADLCAETFAAALVAQRSGREQPRVPAAWLIGIAEHKLADALRRRRVDDRARRELGMRELVLERDDIDAIARLEDEDMLEVLLAGLAPEQRAAVVARVVDERAYDDIAAELRCSEQVVRKRVSRGLQAIRARLAT